MKQKLLLSLLVLTIGVGSYQITSKGQESINSYEGLVVVQIDSVESEMPQKIQDVIGKTSNLYLEYECVWSGVWVIKFSNSKHSNEADNGIMVKNKLRGIVSANKIDVIFVSVRPLMGSSKC